MNEDERIKSLNDRFVLLEQKHKALKLSVILIAIGVICIAIGVML